MLERAKQSIKFETPSVVHANRHKTFTAELTCRAQEVVSEFELNRAFSPESIEKVIRERLTRALLDEIYGDIGHELLELSRRVRDLHSIESLQRDECIERIVHRIYDLRKEILG